MACGRYTRYCKSNALHRAQCFPRADARGKYIAIEQYCDVINMVKIQFHFKSIQLKGHIFRGSPFPVGTHTFYPFYPSNKKNILSYNHFHPFYKFILLILCIFSTIISQNARFITISYALSHLLKALPDSELHKMS